MKVFRPFPCSSLFRGVFFFGLLLASSLSWDDIAAAPKEIITAPAPEAALVPAAVPPRLIGPLPRCYPDEAREARMEALVTVELLINEQGQVLNIRVLKTRILRATAVRDAGRIRQALEECARDIFAKARFTPCLIKGKPSSVRLMQTIQFRYPREGQ